jgi:hypothetical protein
MSNNYTNVIDVTDGGTYYVILNKTQAQWNADYSTIEAAYPGLYGDFNNSNASYAGLPVANAANISENEYNWLLDNEYMVQEVSSRNSGSIEN